MKKRIAIVYDWMDKWGGVERVLLHLHKMLPDATYYTSFVDYGCAPWARNLPLKTSFMQHLGFVRNSRVLALPFFPYAFESFNFSEYDIVFSVTSSFAKAVVTKPGTRHICYLLTPTRFLWVQPENYVRSPFMQALTDLVAKRMRREDFIYAQRPDEIISISQTVADRTKKYYDRSSKVIFPPFDEEHWKNVGGKRLDVRSNNNIQHLTSNFQHGDYFLIVSRLETYKKVDIAIKVFNALPDKHLVIVGTGTQEGFLKNMARSNITFLRDIPDESLAYLYSNAKALIMPQEEDFGYVALEAQYFNCPVIAYGKGGVTETVIDGKTGLFFERQSEGSLLHALERYEGFEYNGKKSDLKKFSKERFEDQFLNIINQ